MEESQIKRAAVVVVPRKRARRWSKVRDFFGAIRDLFSVYFGSQASIARLDPKYRGRLSSKEKAEADADMNGLWTQ